MGDFSRKFLGITALWVVMVSVILGADYDMLTDLGSSAETISRGNVEGFNFTASGMFENPASLAKIENASVGLFMTTLMDEAAYNNLALATRTPFGVIGFGYAETSVVDNPITAQDGNGEYFVTDTFDYRQGILRAAYADYLLPNICFGVSFSQYFNNFGNIKAAGANFDIGITFDRPDVSLSGFIRNFSPNSAIAFDNGNGTKSYEVIPTEFVMSGKWMMSTSFTVFGELTSRNHGNLYAGALQFSPNEFQDLQINGGYRQFYVLDKIKGGITLGVSLTLLGVKASYAYEKIEDHPQYDSKNYFSVSINL